MSEFKQGDMIEVSDYGTDWERREFISSTSNGKFLCWSEDKAYATTWQYTRPIQKNQCTIISMR